MSPATITQAKEALFMTKPLEKGAVQGLAMANRYRRRGLDKTGAKEPPE